MVPWYFKNKFLALVIVAFLFSSFAYTFSFICLSGVYGAFVWAAGISKNVVVVYGVGSSTPFTGCVPLCLVENLSRVSGVVAVSPEVTAFCRFNDKVFVVRGVVPKCFLKTVNLTVVKGRLFSIDEGCVGVVGVRLAERLGIEVGDRLFLVSCFGGSFARVKVVGIFCSGTVLDDEILVPLYVAQWLRGFRYDCVSFIRVKTAGEHIVLNLSSGTVGRKSSSSKEFSWSNFYRKLGPVVVSRTDLSRISLRSGREFGEAFLEARGVTFQAVFTVSALIYLFSLASVYEALHFFIYMHQRELSILRAIGFKKKGILLDLCLKLMPFVLLSTGVGCLLSYLMLLFVGSDLRFFMHSIVLEETCLWFVGAIFLFNVVFLLVCLLICTRGVV